MSRKLLLLICTLWLTAASCKTVPKFVPRVIRQGETVGSAFWLSAPNVIVAKVTDVAVSGALPLQRPKDEQLQLVDVTVEVEALLQGGDPGKTTHYFFYVEGGRRGEYWPKAGERYILFLRSEDGQFRPMADGQVLVFPVYSGRHQTKEVPMNLKIGDKIACILYTPGDQPDYARFGPRLLGNYYLGMDFASDKYLASLLLRLVLDPNSRVRDQACIALATIFWIQPSCLSSVIKSPDKEIQSTGHNLMLRDDELHLAERLKAAPMSLMPPQVGEYALEALELFTFDQRAEVRENACEKLRALAPSRKSRNCR